MPMTTSMAMPMPAMPAMTMPAAPVLSGSISAPVMGSMSAPVSLPATNMFSGYTATPFLPAAGYNLSTFGAPTVTGITGTALPTPLATSVASLPVAGYGTYGAMTSYPPTYSYGTTYGAPTTYAAPAAPGTPTPA